MEAHCHVCVNSHMRSDVTRVSQSRPIRTHVSIKIDLNVWVDIQYGRSVIQLKPFRIIKSLYGNSVEVIKEFLILGHAIIHYTNNKVQYEQIEFHKHDNVIKWKGYWPFVRGIHRSPVNSPHRPLTQGFDVFFDLRMNKTSSKRSRLRCFQAPSRPLWRHCNGKSRKKIFRSVCIKYNLFLLTDYSHHFDQYWWARQLYYISNWSKSTIWSGFLIYRSNLNTTI